MASVCSKFNALGLRLRVGDRGAPRRLCNEGGRACCGDIELEQAFGPIATATFWLALSIPTAQVFPLQGPIAARAQMIPGQLLAAHGLASLLSAQSRVRSPRWTCWVLRPALRGHRTLETNDAKDFSIESVIGRLEAPMGDMLDEREQEHTPRSVATLSTEDAKRAPACADDFDRHSDPGTSIRAEHLGDGDARAQVPHS
ncbi:hypothetical protein N9L68_05735 [bacterium]|nr:hypothetical protein [bacterium]